MSEVVCSAAKATALDSHYYFERPRPQGILVQMDVIQRATTTHTRQMSDYEVEIIYQHSALSCRILIIITTMIIDIIMVMIMIIVILQDVFEECTDPAPAQRPTFLQLLEKLDTCQQQIDQAAWQASAASKRYTYPMELLS